jgi:hypothetical protein
MAESLKDLAGKGLALLVLLLAAYLLFKVALGVVSALVWIVIGIVALVAVIWAVGRIL